MKTKIAGIRILMTALMVLLLAGCSGKSKEPDPNVGVYEAVSVQMSGITLSPDMLSEEFAIELKDGGKGELRFDGDKDSLKWTRDGKNIEIKAGSKTMDGTVKDGVLSISDFGGEEGLDVTLECKSLVRQAARSGKDGAKEKKDDKDNKDNKNDKDDPEKDSKSFGGKSSAASKPSLFSGKSGKNTFGYDMEEAKKYVGDWIGYADLGFATEGRKLHYGIPLGTGGASVYARIVIDENGEPVVYIKAEMYDWLNFQEISATLDENATMRINGYFADNGWAYVLSPPDDNNRKIEIGGPFMTADGGELFHVYLKPIGVQWDKSELPNIKDSHFTVVNQNTKEFGEKGYTLDEILEEMQESYDVRQNLELQGDEQIHLITDELPDASMLNLY